MVAAGCPIGRNAAAAADAERRTKAFFARWLKA